MINAKTAKELASLPSEMESLDRMIRKEAEKGEPDLFVNGELNWEVFKKLRDEHGFDVSYNGNTNKTHIWWGN